jgi:thiol-disulfide isomerase/thioredoxin
MRSKFPALLLLTVCAAAGFFLGRAYWADRASSQPAVAAPERVPAFELTDLSGARRSADEWTSQALIVNFWATWCAPCRKEMPLLQALHQERSGQGLAVIGIAIDEEDPVRSFVGETGVTYPILVGRADAMAVADSFQPGWAGLPMTVIAAPGGHILKVHVGELHPKDLTGIVAVLDRLQSGRISLTEARQALQET